MTAKRIRPGGKYAAGIYIEVTAEEREEIARLAKLERCSIAEFVRKALFSRRRDEEPK